MTYVRSRNGLFCSFYVCLLILSACGSTRITQPVITATNGETRSIIAAAEAYIRQDVPQGEQLCFHSFDYRVFGEAIGTKYTLEYITDSRFYTLTYNKSDDTWAIDKRDVIVQDHCYTIDRQQIRFWPEELAKLYPQAHIFNANLITREESLEYDFLPTEEYWWAVDIAIDDTKDTLFIDAEDGHLIHNANAELSY